MLITVASIKGSPGVTSLAVALAARWPTPGAVVVEADPAGGDLAFRFGHRREPGLSDLAVDTRAGDHGRDLSAYTQTIPPGVGVVFAPADQQLDDDGHAPQVQAPGQVVQAVQMVARNCLGLLHQTAHERLVVVDVGRLGWDSPALPLACIADVLLIVTRPGVDAVDAVAVRRDRILGLPGMRASLRLVLAGRLPCPAREIADVVGLPVAGQLPDDRKGAAVLGGRATPGWGWTRLESLRAARALALSLAAEETAVRAGRHAAPTAPRVAGAQKAIEVNRT